MPSIDQYDLPTLARMFSDLSSQVDSQAKDIQVVRQEAKGRPQQVVQQSSGLFTYVDPHVEVFTDTGSGANSLGAAQTLDFGPYVSSSARLAFCVLSVLSARSGGDASDSNLYAEWLPDGGTTWLKLGKNFDSHELTDDATVDDFRHSMVPLGSSRSGQVRVFEALDTWTYTLTMFGYL